MSENKFEAINDEETGSEMELSTVETGKETDEKENELINGLEGVNSRWLFMTKHYLSLAGSAVAQNMIMFLIWQLNIIYAASLGDSTVVAGIGLMTATVNIMCNSILIGLNGAQENLVSQAYGMKELNLCGRYLNRGLMLLVTFFIPLAVLLLFVEDILVATGQDAAVAAVAGRLVKGFIPAVFMGALVDLLKRFLTCCNYAFVPMVAMVITSVVHVFWLWVFVTAMDMGVNGVPMAMCITVGSQVIIIFVYARRLPEL